jgi:hypothetical protein
MSVEQTAEYSVGKKAVSKAFLTAEHLAVMKVCAMVVTKVDCSVASMVESLVFELAVVRVGNLVEDLAERKAVWKAGYLVGWKGCVLAENSVD